MRNPGYVNPMLGLRNAVCSDRWDEAWEQICGYRLQHEQEGRRQRAHHRAALSNKALSDKGAVPVVEALPRLAVTEPTPAAEAVLSVEKAGVAEAQAILATTSRPSLAQIPGLYPKPESFSPSYGRKNLTDTL
jgi:hypothetical protein